MPPSSPVLAAIGAGSNLGDREAHLRSAFARLERLHDSSLLATSSFFRTAPVPGDSPAGIGALTRDDLGGEYLNAAALLRTSLTARELLNELLRIELDHGRVRDPSNRWGPRTLDLDLLTYSDQVISEPGLSIPHPRMHTRSFVLEPLASIAPDLVVPNSNRTVADLWRQLQRTTATL